MSLWGLVVSGCAASADTEALNWPVHQPLINGRVVTIEIIHVNGQQGPGQAVDRAVRRFGRHLAGELRTAQGEPVHLPARPDGLPTRDQLAQATKERRFGGPSDITIYITPGLSDHKQRGGCEHRPDGSHVIVLHGENIDASIPPLVTRQRCWQLVIMHELSHTLGVPSGRCHSWSGRHCTNPTCVLYPRPDVRSVLVAIVRLGPPIDLCAACRAEVRRAQQAAGGKLVPPDRQFNRMDQLDELVRLNPGEGRAYVLRAQAHYGRGGHDQATVDLTKAIELGAGDDLVRCHRNRGAILSAVGKYGQALHDYRRCMELRSDDHLTLNNLAWLLATCGDDALRDGPRAVELARRACELSGWKQPNLLGTLAAAYAETGQFERAIEYQQEAIGLASPKEVKRLRKALRQYKAGEPYRDEPKAP